MALVACGSDPASRIPPQQWKNLHVEVQSRPMPVTQGMNEFWLIISENERRPAHDLIVSIRAGESGP